MRSLFASFCLIAAAGIQKVSALALFPVFFFMGTMFPTVFTLAIRDLGEHTKRASSLMVMTIGEAIGQSGHTNTMKIVRVGEHRKA